MAIRKYGNEPAQTEVLAEDQDPETLNSIRKRAHDDPEGREPHRDRKGEPDLLD